MAGHTTKAYRNTLSGSVGAGIGSLFNPSGRKYYILEHKVSSKYHKAGESQEIIVDNIELGRDSHCQVRFDESFKTVSRHHAGIVKDGDMWKLVQISKSNSTFLNGRPVKTEWYLQNGDEIQLSVNGPKLGFIVPTGKKATVGSIGLTRRMSLFRQQALRPYKTAIASLAVCLVLAIIGLGGWNWKLHEDLRNQSLQLAEQIIKNKDNKELVDSLAKKLAEANNKIAAADEKIGNIKKAQTRTVTVRRPVTTPASGDGAGSSSESSSGASISSCYPYTYSVTCFVVAEDGKPITYKNRNGKDCYVAWSGTGFLLNNGYFVTAHHMIHFDEFDFDEGGNIIPNTVNTVVNTRYYSGQWKIKMIAVSSSGDKLNLDYSYTNCPFKTGNTKMEQATITDEAGRTWVVRAHLYADGTDWACVKVSRSTGLAYDGAFSKNMPAQTKLTILGFPSNMDQTQNGTISPDVSEAITSRHGLEDGGWIRTSNENTDHGNSGGPVLTIRNGKQTVVGILSGANFGSDKSHRKGRIIPIGAAFN